MRDLLVTHKFELMSDSVVPIVDDAVVLMSDSVVTIMVELLMSDSSLDLLSGSRSSIEVDGETNSPNNWAWNKKAISA
jgi:hypothetical protein